jgi:hypothetical protein
MPTFLSRNTIGNQHGNACERDTASSLGVSRISRQIAGSQQVKNGVRDGLCHPTESSRHCSAYPLARAIPECAAKSFRFPIRKVRPCWKRPQLLQLCNRPVNANATWGVRMGKRPRAAKVSCRFHYLCPTFISRLAESQASDSTIMALAGHAYRAMMERYSHIRHGSETQGG